MSALVHRESCLLAQAARRAAVRASDNLVVDTVLQDPRSALGLGAEREQAGYTLSVLDADCPFEVSGNGIRARWV